jgi:transposase InsO family protein
MSQRKGEGNSALGPVLPAVSWDEVETQYPPDLVTTVRAAAAASKAVTREGLQYLRRSLHAPSRVVRSTHSSMSGRFPSLKMRRSIQFESATLEGPAILKLEADPTTIAFLDQPQPLKVTYRRAGRLRSHLQTPDFLRVQHGKVTLIECKPLEKVLERNQRDTDYYVQEAGRWVCTALQTAARELGFDHEVWTESSFNPTEMRNLRMLAAFMRDTRPAGYQEALRALHEILRARGRATVADLLHECGNVVGIDHVYAAIAHADVAFDWSKAPLTEPGSCWLYRDAPTQRAFMGMEQSIVPPEKRIVGAGHELREGVPVKWDGKIWMVLNVGESAVLLGRGDTHTQLPRHLIEQLIRDGLVEVVRQADDIDPLEDAHQFVAKARPKDLRTGNLRYARISPFVESGLRTTDRTLRRYIQLYREAQRRYGSGYVGLIPGYASSGNRAPRLSGDVLALALDTAKNHYANNTNKCKQAAYRLLSADCDAKNLPLPSYSWFCRFLDRLPKYQTALARGGAKAAYPLKPRIEQDDTRVDNEPDRPWERAHVDHTLTDLETVFGETGEKLGRVWLTVLVDHFSRRVLAFYLTYDAPSYRSVLMVMRKCVQRWGRLPEALVVDGGKEFRSIWFQTTCALYRVAVIYRPISQSRFGSQGERMFGTANTSLFHLLQGNTQLRKNVRQMTGEVDPDRHAIWTLPELSNVAQKFFFEIYDNLDHSELLVSPRLAYERGMRLHGRRAHRLIPYNQQFIITTSPSTEKGTAKVQADGVKINYLMYSHPDLQRHIRASVEVRYDPFDMSRAWAFVDRRWLELKSRHKPLLQMFAEHDIDLAVIEWKRRRNFVGKKRLNEASLIKFLKEILQTETLLLERKRAAEERRLREEADRDQDLADDDGDSDESQVQSDPSAAESDDVFALDASSIQILQPA